LLAAALVVSALCAELAVRAVYPRIANYNLEMWRFLSVFKLPQDNPRLPFTMRPGKAASVYGVHLATNSLGLRDREYPPRPDAGVTRILLLGDSHTLGWGVPLEQTISRQLERRLNAGPRAFEVINLGVGNYNAIMVAEQFRQKGLPLHPDIVIWIYFVNDAEATPAPSGPWFHLGRHSYLGALLFDRYVALRARLDPGFDWRERYAALYRPENPWLAPNREAIAGLWDLCRQHAIPGVMASLPCLQQLDPYPLPEATEFARNAAAESRVRFVDLLPVLAPEPPETLWVSAEDPHANGRAAARIAAALHGALADAGQVPPPAGDPPAAP
jgi:hypothetical protein